MVQIYRHRRLDTNEVFYVGIGSNKYRSKSKHNRNRHWLNIVNKVKYTIETVAIVDTWEDACDLEQLLILEYGRRDLGTGTLVNMTNGGEGAMGYVKTKEEILRHSNILSIKYKGNKNPFYGKKHTEETKKLISTLQKKYFTYDEGCWDNITIKKYNDSVNNKKSRRVINTRTNLIFNSLREASEYYNINYYTLKGRMLKKRINNHELKYLEKDEQESEDC